jgi:hypothetical protein
MGIIELIEKRAGYAPLADLLTLELQVMQDLTGSGELLVCDPIISQADG